MPAKLRILTRETFEKRLFLVVDEKIKKVHGSDGQQIVQTCIVNQNMRQQYILSLIATSVVLRISAA